MDPFALLAQDWHYDGLHGDSLDPDRNPLAALERLLVELVVEQQSARRALEHRAQHVVATAARLLDSADARVYDPPDVASAMVLLMLLNDVLTRLTAAARDLRADPRIVAALGGPSALRVRIDPDQLNAACDRIGRPDLKTPTVS